MLVALVRGIRFKQDSQGFWGPEEWGPGTRADECLRDIAHALHYANIDDYLDACGQHPEHVRKRLRAL